MKRTKKHSGLFKQRLFAVLLVALSFSVSMIEKDFTAFVFFGIIAVGIFTTKDKLM